MKVEKQKTKVKSKKQGKKITHLLNLQKMGLLN